MSVSVDVSLSVIMKPSETDIRDTYLVSSKDSVVIHSSFIKDVSEQLYKLFHYEASRLHHHYCEGIKAYEEAGQRPPRTAIKKAAYAKAVNDTIAKFGKKLYEEAQLLKAEHSYKNPSNDVTKAKSKPQAVAPVESTPLFTQETISARTKPSSNTTASAIIPSTTKAGRVAQVAQVAPKAVAPVTNVSATVPASPRSHSSPQKSVPVSKPPSSAFDLDDFDLPDGEEVTNAEPENTEPEKNPFA